MDWGSRILVTVFVVFWTVIVGFFDLIIGSSLVDQARAGGYATTQGVVMHAHVAREISSKGRSVHRPDIRYAYEVDGRRFESVRYRYNEGATSDSEWAARVVRDLPAGGAVTVRYDPRDPAESVLDARINGSDLLLPLFMTPFNVVLVALWWFVGGWALGKVRGAPCADSGGLRVSDDGRATRVRLDEFSAPAYGLAAFGAAGFVATFIALIGGGGFHPDIRFVAVLWALVIGAGVFVAVRQHRHHASGEADLVIDRLARHVDLPKGFARKQRETVRAGEIAAVVVATEERPRRRGRIETVHVVMLRRRDGRIDRLIEFPDKERADALAAWLREKIGVA